MSKYGYRIIKARWAKDAIIQEAFEAAVRITGVDTLGLVGKVTDIISKQLKVNMKSISFESLDGTFSGTMVLVVSDTSHLQQLMEELSSIDDHMQVKRIALKDLEATD
jgi:GTP pyrophosphokinase